MSVSVSPLHFAQADCTAGQSAVALKVMGEAGVDGITMPWKGAIVGITVDCEADRTAGTCKAVPTVGGTASSTLEAKLDATNARHHYARHDKGSDQFAAGAVLGVKVTTDAQWAAGTTPSLVVTLWVQRFRTES